MADCAKVAAFGLDASVKMS